MPHPREAFRRLLEKSPLLPAPMCGYSDRPYRELLRAMGAHLVYTEMFSAEAVIRGDPNTWRLMDFQGEAPPVVVQLFGNRPAALAEAARIVVRLGAAVVDLNMGCPVRKVTKTGCGAALPDDPVLMRDVLRAMRRALQGVPFTAKMRWREGGETLAVARLCEAEGLDAVALHARTRAQAYAGEAEWEWIARLKNEVGIPVVGNGDVRTADDVRRMREETGCDAAMAGRGIVGNPWLMRDAAALAAGAAIPPPPDPPERLRTLLTHAWLMERHRGERGMVEFRKHCATYVKGMPEARAARAELMQVSDTATLRQVVETHFGPVDWTPPAAALEHPSCTST